MNLERRARLDEIGRRQRDPGLAPGQTHRERRDAVAQRTREHLVRVHVSHERHRDVTVAFHAVRQRNPLHRAGRSGPEPTPRVHAVALDGDQAGAGVGRLDLELDGLARGVVSLVERQLQLGISLQRSSEIRRTGHVVLDARQLGRGRVSHHEREVAGLDGRQRHGESRGRDRERHVAHRGLLLDRLILVGPVKLPSEYRHVADADARETQLARAELLAVGTDRDELHGALAILLQIAQVPVRFVADQERLVRHDRARLRGDAATPLGLVPFRDEAQAIGGSGKPLQPEVELRLAGGIGRGGRQLVRVGLLGLLRVGEAVVFEPSQGGEAGRQLHSRGHAAARGRGPEQVLEGDACREAVGGDPSVRRFRREMRGHGHPVGLKFAHQHRDAAQQRAGSPVLHDVQRDGPSPGRRRFRRGVLDFLESLRGEPEPFSLYLQAPGIGDHRLERDAGERRRPVGRLHDHADVERIAGPIHAAIGKEVGGELVRLQRIRHAADIETREVEVSILAIDREEREILAAVGGVQHRRALPLERLEAREAHVPFGIGLP